MAASLHMPAEPVLGAAFRRRSLEQARMDGPSAGFAHKFSLSEASGASGIRYLLLELRSEEIPARSRDVRGVISVTGRQSYIRPVRNLAKACGEAFLMTDGERRAPARHIRDAAASIARLTRIE